MRSGSEQDRAAEARRHGHAVSLLITGFGRYPGVRRNPTAVLVQRVVAQLGRRQGLAVTGWILTVSYDTARRELATLDARDAPDAFLLLGLAPRARRVRIEQFARLSDSALHPDASGRGGSRLATSSRTPLKATARVEPALQAMQREGVKARLSASAGRYLCNAVYAAALARGRGRPVLFVHLPYPLGFTGNRPCGSGRGRRPTQERLEQALITIALGLAIQARRARKVHSGLA